MKKKLFTSLVVTCAAAAAVFAMVAPASSSSRAVSSSAGALSEWELIRSSTQSYKTSYQKWVYCSAGKKVLGGGFHIVGGGQSHGFGGDSFYVHISRPTNNNDGWLVGWFKGISLTDDKTFYVQVYAICAKV